MAEIRLEELSPSAVILHLNGYLDRPLGESLKSRVQELAQSGKKDLVISFAEVQMINSLGMSGLIESFDIADETQTEIWFVEINATLTPILEAAGVLNLVIEPMSLAEARERLK